MKNQTNYGKGFSYEILLRYAFNLNERSPKKGADSSIYETLFHIESGINLIKGNTYEKQFTVIKKHLEKGLEALLKKKLFSLNETNDLKALKLKLEKAFNEPDLESIIGEALTLIIPYKETWS